MSSPSDVDPDRRAEVAIDSILIEQRRWAMKNRRPAALTAREAMAASKFECLVIWTAAQNIFAGVELTAADRERMNLAMRRIVTIFDEAA